MWDGSGGTRAVGVSTSSSCTHFTAREVEAQRSEGTLTIWKSEMELRLEPKFPEHWPPVFNHPKPEHTPEVCEQHWICFSFSSHNPREAPEHV